MSAPHFQAAAVIKRCSGEFQTPTTMVEPSETPRSASRRAIRFVARSNSRQVTIRSPPACGRKIIAGFSGCAAASSATRRPKVISCSATQPPALYASANRPILQPFALPRPDAYDLSSIGRYALVEVGN